MEKMAHFNREVIPGRGDFPGWTMYVRIMTEEQGRKYYENRLTLPSAGNTRAFRSLKSKSTYWNSAATQRTTLRKPNSQLSQLLPWCRAPFSYGRGAFKFSSSAVVFFQRGGK